jgi:hypothetical protein
MKLKNIVKRKRENFAQLQAISNDAFKTTLFQKSSTIKAYNALAVLILLY